MAERNGTKRQSMVYKTLHRNLRLSVTNHKHYLKSGVNSGTPEGYAT